MLYCWQMYDCKAVANTSFPDRPREISYFKNNYLYFSQSLFHYISPNHTKFTYYFNLHRLLSRFLGSNLFVLLCKSQKEFLGMDPWWWARVEKRPKKSCKEKRKEKNSPSEERRERAESIHCEKKSNKRKKKPIVQVKSSHRKCVRI